MANQQSDYDPTNDTIFVTNLPEDTTEDQLSQFFGQIGVIKFDKKNKCPKIWVYKDKESGKGKGEATITYDDPPTATSAISWFNGKQFRGSTLKIELAQRRPIPQFSRGGRGGGGGRGSFRNDNRGGGYADRGDRGQRDDRGGRSSGQGRPGDWLCPSCNNNNFSYRQECNRCRTAKPAGSESSGGGGGARGGGGGGGGYNGGGARHHRDESSRDHRGHRNDSNFRDNDHRSGGNRDRDRDRGRDRDSHGDRQNRSGHGGSGPSRNHVRDRDDRRSRPY